MSKTKSKRRIANGVARHDYWIYCSQLEIEVSNDLRCAPILDSAALRPG